MTHDLPHRSVLYCRAETSIYQNRDLFERLPTSLRSDDKGVSPLIERSLAHVTLPGCTKGRIVTPATPLDNLLLPKGDTSTKVESSLGNQERQKDLCLSPSGTRIALNCCSEVYRCALRRWLAWKPLFSRLSLWINNISGEGSQPS